MLSGPPEVAALGLGPATPPFSVALVGDKRQWQWGAGRYLLPWPGPGSPEQRPRQNGFNDVV